MIRYLVIVGTIATIGSALGMANEASAAGTTTASENSSSRYSDKVEGISDDIPKRPQPLEILQGFKKEGPLKYEFQLPTGMVVSPNLLLYANYRTGIQAIDTTGDNDPRVEWANTLGTLANLEITGTERILFGMTPIHQGGKRTRYTFKHPDPALEGEFEDELNRDITTAFFEGELSEIFPIMDRRGTRPLDFGIAVGRQPVQIQEGFLIADTMDSVAVTRNTVPIPGTTFARVTALYAWRHKVHRRMNQKDTEAQLIGLFGVADVGHSTWDLGMTYLTSKSSNGGDQANFALSAQQPIVVFHRLFSTTFRTVGSVAVDDKSPAASSGVLFYVSVSTAPRKTEDIVYLNLFGAISDYSASSRGAGGPLGRTGLLFAGNGLTSGFGSPISNRADESFGGALGRQFFFNNRRTQLFGEVGGKFTSEGSSSAFGVAAKVSQALWHHLFVSVDGFGVRVSTMGGDFHYGMRSEVNFIF